MRSKLALGLLVLAMVATAATPVRAQDSWLHIRVVERDGDGEQVNINVPLKLIESLLPLIESDDEGGDVHLSRGRIRFGCNELDDMDFRALLTAIRDAEDGEYVTVKGRHENVRVAKEKGDLIINADDEGERVRVKMKMKIVEAMLKADQDELDLLAMVQALGEHGEGELVTVDSDEETVRIWIDKKSSE